MNVGELKEILDDFGDHLPVEVVVSRGESEKRYAQYTVTDYNYNGTPTVVLEVET